MTTELFGNICKGPCNICSSCKKALYSRSGSKPRTGFRWSQGNSSTAQPDGIEIKFDNEDVGKQSRLHGDEGTEPGSTVIYTMTARFQGTNGRHTLECYQFPLVLAWCITIHKVQGLSLDKAVIDLGQNVFANSQAYVALSRVRNLEGVMLTGLQRSKMNLIDNAVHEEYARLALRPISS